MHPRPSNLTLNDAVVYFISKNMMLFQAVEKPGFFKLMKTAVPLYKVPSGKYFSDNAVPKRYAEVRGHVQKQVAKGMWFSAMTDLWTSNGSSGEPYISFTVHFLSPEWELKSYCLETHFFPEDHTADNIIEFFENMLQE